MTPAPSHTDRVFPPSRYFNVLGREHGIFGADPVAMKAILNYFRSNTSCPWSMHKLDRQYVEEIFSVAKHCMAPQIRVTGPQGVVNSKSL